MHRTLTLAKRGVQSVERCSAYSETSPMISLTECDGCIVGEMCIGGNNCIDEPSDRRRLHQRHVDRKHDDHVDRLRAASGCRGRGECRDDCPERALPRKQIDHVASVANFGSRWAADIHTINHTGTGQRRELVDQQGALSECRRRLVAAEAGARTTDQHCAECARACCV